MKTVGRKPQRPNTEDTLRQFLQMTHRSGDTLVVSNNPFIGYQASVVRSILPDKYRIFTVGPKLEFSNDKNQLGLILDSLARWIFEINKINTSSSVEKKSQARKWRF